MCTHLVKLYHTFSTWHWFAEHFATLGGSYCAAKVHAAHLTIFQLCWDDTVHFKWMFLQTSVLFSCAGMILCKPTKGGHAGMSKSNIVSQQSQFSREIFFIQHIKLCIIVSLLNSFQETLSSMWPKTALSAQTMRTAIDKWNLMECHRYFKCATSQNWFQVGIMATSQGDKRRRGPKQSLQLFKSTHCHPRWIQI